MMQSPGIALQPIFLPVKRRIQECADVATLEISLLDLKSTADEDMANTQKPNSFEPLSHPLEPGQFTMIYAFGVGEIPVSISAYHPEDDRLIHTIRGVGPVSNALLRLESGQLLGLRGPYGRGWPIAEANGKDVVLIAGGIGMAPLRPVMHHLIRHRNQYGNIILLYGARHPDDLLYKEEVQQWRSHTDMQVYVTVDHATADWQGDVGVVTQLLDRIEFDVAETIAMICGPDLMIRFTSMALENQGVSLDHIHVSMERNMKCAIGSCGHCQFGPHFICKDGPVFPLADIRELFSLREI